MVISPEATTPPRNLNILIVDDDQSFSRPVALYLNKRFGHNTRLVDSAAQAYEELQRTSFDIIILDYKLADGSGLDVLRWISERGIGSPVVMVTGHGCEEVAVDAMKLGAYDYANKGHISFDYIPVIIHSAYQRYLRTGRSVVNTPLPHTTGVIEQPVLDMLSALANIEANLQACRHEQPDDEGGEHPQAMEAALSAIDREVKYIKRALASLSGLDVASSRKHLQELHP